MSNEISQTDSLEKDFYLYKNGHYHLKGLREGKKLCLSIKIQKVHQACLK